MWGGAQMHASSLALFRRRYSGGARRLASTSVSAERRAEKRDHRFSANPARPTKTNAPKNDLGDADLSPPMR